MRLPLRLLGKAETVVAFAVLLGLVVALQAAGGAHASGFGGYPDEPAHVVTSLMVRDFIAGLTSVIPFSSHSNIISTTRRWRLACGRPCSMARSASGS